MLLFVVLWQNKIFIVMLQVLGFVVGPAIQAAVTFLGSDGFSFFGLPINMYTSVGWINVLMGILNFVLFLPWTFTEHRIAAREAMKELCKTTGEFQNIYLSMISYLNQIVFQFDIHWTSFKKFLGTLVLDFLLYSNYFSYFNVMFYLSDPYLIDTLSPSTFPHQLGYCVKTLSNKVKSCKECLSGPRFS